MDEVIVTGERVELLEASGETLEDAVRAYREKHGGLVPDGWESERGDGVIIGLCEGCERPITDNEPYFFDPEDVIYECVGCPRPREGSTDG